MSRNGSQSDGDDDDHEFGHVFRPPTGPLAQEDKPLPVYAMFLLALAVGVFGGFGAIAFRSIIALFHNIFFYGQFALTYDPDAHIEPSPLGALVILVPVAGAVAVTWITRTMAPEARGHGVPEVLGAIYHRRGHISPVVVLAKSLASAISVGTGGSVGREGPIIQIGSAFGSTLGQLTRMPTRQRITLIGAGAAAGIAATFNAPIGGLAFAIELLLVSISAHTVALVAMATVMATYIGRLYSGLSPSFDVPRIAHFADHLVNLYTLALCVPFGLLVGGASTLFIRSLYWMEDGFRRSFTNEYLRHVCGMLAVGVLMYAMLRLLGNYYVAGVGYATIMDVLRGALADPMLLVALFAAKLLATTLTLGSGASGGVFSPSLFLGATLGGAFGGFFAWVFPGTGIEPVVFAVAGMAGMVSGTTGAVLTAITMLVEQTRDYSAILPIITTVALACVVRVWLTPESIYTLKLARRGTAVPQGLESPVSSGKKAEDMMSTDFQVVDVSELRDWQLAYRPGEGPRYTVVADNDRIIGIARPELVYLLRDIDPDAVIDRNVFSATGDTRWPVIMRGLRIKDADVALVTARRHSHRREDLIGVLTSREVARAAGDSAELLE
ncbi:chloride channel protein [Aquisalimonas lutea]|uniref:chloride channel protein n=1 Tax=Aquisalimonas lutea TaxID=1327750 RepID=UPI0025B2A33D|nr:chloride channel protein [Aquisalimonas lutea]MDN3516941.1 chloride channel protein [Aquisalimonas lutea]